MTEPEFPDLLRKVVADASTAALGPEAIEIQRRGRRRQRLCAAAAVGAAAVVVTGLVSVVALSTGSPTGKQHVSLGRPNSVGSQDPTGLVGLWRVTADGSTGDSLKLGDEVTLFQSCGVLDGSWKADSAGDFVAMSYGGDSTCFTGDHQLTPAWLLEATAFRVDGSARELLDVHGAVVARLDPGATPTVNSNRIKGYADPPTLTPALRQRLSEPVALPDGIQPATAASLVGHWVPKDGDGRAYVDFTENGNFSGSDGCNGSGGRFAVGDAGHLLALEGGSSLIGCNGVNVPSWAGQAGRAGFDGDELVFYDSTGTVLGRLIRGAAPTGTP